jgi:hypothetical protein
MRGRPGKIMDQKEARELEREIERAKRLAAGVADQTTVQRRAPSRAASPLDYRELPPSNVCQSV